MLKPPEKRFLFNAYAVALAATFRKPKDEFLEAQAPVALPGSGGMASARVENFSFRNIISFRSAHSQASGTHNRETGAYNTLVTSVIEGFSIMGVVTADRIVARLASRHFIEPPGDAIRTPEPSIRTLGSHIDNLQIAGHKVTLALDHEIQSDWHTYSLALEGHHKRETGYTVYGPKISTSIFKGVDCELKPAGHRIEFPELGTLYLGEIHMETDERRLTMIRFELGCSIEAIGGTGDVGGNGSPVPPIG